MKHVTPSGGKNQNKLNTTKLESTDRLDEVSNEFKSPLLIGNRINYLDKAEKNPIDTYGCLDKHFNMKPKASQKPFKTPEHKK